MGIVEWVKERFAKEPEETQIDPSEKSARLSLKIVVLTVLLFIFLGIEAYYGVLFSWGMPTTILLMLAINAVTLIQYSIVWMEMDSRQISDNGGLRAPIRRDKPVSIKAPVDENGDSLFFVKRMKKDKNGKSVLDHVRYHDFLAIQGGLSSYVETHRPVWYIWPDLPERVPGFNGRPEMEINYGGIEKVRQIEVNGKFHKYKYFHDVPEDFRFALSRLHGFNKKKHRVRILTEPEMDLSKLLEISVSSAGIKTSEQTTKELDSSRKVIGHLRKQTERTHEAYAEDSGKSGGKSGPYTRPSGSSEEEVEY